MQVELDFKKRQLEEPANEPNAKRLQVPQAATSGGNGATAKCWPASDAEVVARKKENFFPS
eukprot:13867825-Heterocapsa_arctica.AAC.1